MQLDDRSLDIIFREARTHNVGWTSRSATRCCSRSTT